MFTLKHTFKHLHRVALSGICTLLIFTMPQAQAQPGKQVALFDGKTLNGWDYDPKVWRVQDGAITAGSHEQKFPRNSFIATQKTFANFDLSLKIKCSGDPKTGLINSGIQIRSKRLKDDPASSVKGYQVDCGQGWFGKIYDEHRRGLIFPKPLNAGELAAKVDTYGWNEYRILAEGPRIQVWINGVNVSDYTEKDANIPLNGIIAPQIHSGGKVMVQVKDITIRELPATPGAPTWEAPAPAKTPAKAAKKIKVGNAQHGQPLTAAEQLKRFKLPQGYEIELVAQESEGVGKFISVYFDQRGRMWTQTALEYPVDANENKAAAEALYRGHGRDKVLVYPREVINQALPPEGLTEATVFADGLAIPLGILPWGKGDSAYVMHGTNLLLLTDTDADGKADQREVVLTGFGIQDSHLFPHQFTRAPGGWIWMAQGLFNDSEVKKPGSEKAVTWRKCSMARMRPDGDAFEVTSVGPNNIWGLALTGEGECFIQEANDYGFPVMPFHDYAYYPGGMGQFKKTYQPSFPPMTGFRMGGSGLSGLAQLENGPAVTTGNAITMLVANPITGKVQTIGMQRKGPHWSLEKLPDLVTCDDPFYRPVALTEGPDGCVYIVDWYNKIISHNEVPRTHPERDKTRGRIWRIKPTSGDGVLPVPDFSSLENEQLIGMLGKQPTARAHLAWQTLADRDDPAIDKALAELLASADTSDAVRIQAMWILGDHAATQAASLRSSENRNLRRELARSYSHAQHLLDDPDPEVRFAAITTMGRNLPDHAKEILPRLLAAVQPSTALSAKASKQERYDHQFARFLIRKLLTRHRDQIALSAWLDSDAAATVPIEGRLWATLALEPEEAARKLATLLPDLQRAPNSEEILGLARYPQLPECGEALGALLASEAGFASTAATLLANQTKLDPTGLIKLLEPATVTMLASSGKKRITAMKLIGGFGVRAALPKLVALLKNSGTPLTDAETGAVLDTLRQLNADAPDLLAELAFEPSLSEATRDKAFAALMESGSRDAALKVVEVFAKLSANQQRQALEAMSAKKASAEVVLEAVIKDGIDKELITKSVAGKLHRVAGKTPAFAEMMSKMGAIFRDVLVLNGSSKAWADTNLTLEGAFTVEAWVRLDAGISNADTLLGSAQSASFNFHDSKFRVWIKPLNRDVVISGRESMPGLWTHIAIVRDAAGNFTLYSDGQRDAVGTIAYAEPLSALDIGWSPVGAGTAGSIAEFRVWDHARSEAEISTQFDRSLSDQVGQQGSPKGLVFYNAGGGENWGALQQGASITATLEAPELLTKSQAEELDAKFSKYTKLIKSGTGRPEVGAAMAALCTSCHVIDGQGGKIGPDISGLGLTGHEAVLRNILTPNAAMESGYRIYRVEMKNGDLLDASFVSEDENAVVVRETSGGERRIDKKDIASSYFLRRSLMPEGLLESMPDQSAADLLSYLMSLK
ncbi:MAG: PVC-type heme-binding CxxCH protein [Akkermansiaceae bacterium]